MSVSFLMGLALAAFAGCLVWLARREHRNERAQRRRMLDACGRLFDAYDLRLGGDGFARLSGRKGDRRFDVRLISDGMTLRRLPQLWLQVTELAPLAGLGGLAVLVRPSGYEFFSLTADFHHVLDAPPSFPREVIVRGETADAGLTLSRVAPPMAALLADPHIKEIAVTRRGMRIVRQADEGRRGEYLLLRQAAFAKAEIPVAMLAEVLDGLDALRAALATPKGELARA